MSLTYDISDKLLIIKNLQKEYNSNLVLYQAAKDNYINALDNSITYPSDFVSISNSKWTAVSETTTATTLTTAADRNACINTCAADTACTGSTYTTSATNNCSSIRGPGIITPSISNSIALIPQLTNYLITLNTLNTLNATLIASMDSLEDALDSIQPNLVEENNNLLDSSEFQQNFKIDYEKLLGERNDIAELLANYNDVSSKYDEKTLFASRENNSLRIWTIGTVIMLIFIIKYAFGLDSPAINTIFWITVIVLLGLTLSNPTGFIGLGILFLIFLSVIIKN
jgi:hypothetical protein